MRLTRFDASCDLTYFLSKSVKLVVALDLGRDGKTTSDIKNQFDAKCPHNITSAVKLKKIGIRAILCLPDKSYNV